MVAGRLDRILQQVRETFSALKDAGHALLQVKNRAVHSECRAHIDPEFCCACQTLWARDGLAAIESALK